MKNNLNTVDKIIPQTEIDSQLQQQKLWRKRRRWWLIPLICSALLWIGIETLMLKNIPFLIATIILICSLFLIQKLLDWQFACPKPRTWQAVKLSLISIIIYASYFALILFVMRHYVPITSISKKNDLYHKTAYAGRA
ncbi:MAG: hypothetical protein LBB88_00260 [Planctomycetaceae bacterium]|jgi:hypothetical protein|nr:hypothetical protein [Planctomycetaceae bacterium]